MRISCVGGGPAGLFFAILASGFRGEHQITVHERLPEGTTYGWGVVFWDDLLEQLDRREPVVAERIRAAAYRWVDQVVEIRGREPVRIHGHGYSICRHTLIGILAGRAREVGVEVRYGSAVSGEAELGDVDLAVAGDGVNSTLRRQGSFGTTVVRRRNKYIWLGTSRVFDSFTFPFVFTGGGWLWAHAYGYNGRASTFVVESTPESWLWCGFDRLDADATLHRLGELFDFALDGHPLQLQAGTRDIAPWVEFQAISNARWHDGRVALLGDAAHTTHFTVGSGTRLAMEDAMALADALVDHDLAVEPALDSYERRRAAAVRLVQRKAANSARWFEEVPRYIDHDRFADLLLRRRAAAQAYLPPHVFLRLSDAALSVPAVTGPARRAVERVLSFSR